jgi:hypothetical protein
VWQCREGSREIGEDGIELLELPVELECSQGETKLFLTMEKAMSAAEES